MTESLTLNFSSDKPFYVYLYRDPRSHKRLCPIYVGKGMASRGRAYHHWRQRSHNSFLNRILDKIAASGLAPVIEIVGWFDLESDAYDLEKTLISKIGRRDLGKGPLVNLADGGGGLNGISAESRKRAGEKLKGRCFSDEHRKKISAAKKGVKRPDNSERNKSIFAGKKFKMKLSSQERERRRQSGTAAAQVNFRNLSTDAKMRRIENLREAARRQWEVMTDEQLDTMRSAIARGLRKKSKDTK